MGVDATLFVCSDYGNEFGVLTVNLGRWYDDYEVLRRLHSVGKQDWIQLPRGSWSGPKGGRPKGEEWSDSEFGWLRGDSYTPNAGFELFAVDDIKPYLNEFGSYNGPIFEFVTRQFAGHKFCIIWH